jgi:hypothetical protein
MVNRQLTRLCAGALPVLVVGAIFFSAIGCSERSHVNPEKLQVEPIWRKDPRLSGRFHADSPDDLQVLVHDGGPRLTDRTPEVVWVSVTGMKGNIFQGKVLNQPEQLTSVSQNSEIHFMVPEGGEYPLMVTDKYLRERSEWIIEPCDKCGLSELFDAPSDLIKVIFNPSLDQEIEAFTSFCGFCGGTQMVIRKDFKEEMMEEEDDE